LSGINVVGASDISLRLTSGQSLQRLGALMRRHLPARLPARQKKLPGRGGWFRPFL
jgi:hypothetical protein